MPCKHQQIAAEKFAAVLGETRPNMLVVDVNETMRIVDRNTSHVIFLMFIARVWSCAYHIALLKCLHARVTPHSGHPWWAVERLFLVSSFWLSPCVSLSLCSSSQAIIPCVSATQESCSLADFTLPTGCEPKLLDEFHHSETSAMNFQDESRDKDTEPSNLCDGTRRWDYRKCAIFTTVHSGARRTSGPQTSLSLSWTKFVVSRCLSVMQERGDPCTNLARWVRAAERNQVATQKMSESGFSLNDKKNKFSLILEQRFKNTSSKPILIGVSRNWMELLCLGEEKLVIVLQVMNNFDEMNHFIMNSYWNKIGIFVWLMRRVSKIGRIEAISRLNWSKIKILSLNSLARCRNCGMKSMAWAIREIFQMLNQYAVDIPTLPVKQCFFPIGPGSWWNEC